MLPPPVDVLPWQPDTADVSRYFAFLPETARPVAALAVNIVTLLPLQPASATNAGHLARRQQEQEAAAIVQRLPRC